STATTTSWATARARRCHPRWPRPLASRCRSPSRRSPPTRSSLDASTAIPPTLTTRPSSRFAVLDGRRIVLGVTGGIAAYKAIEVCRRLVDEGAHVSPILTNGALHFVGETTFSAL